jgi:AcrR family transcriptional regulator
MAQSGSGSSGNDSTVSPRSTRGDRRRKILDAAVQLFSEHPYDDVFIGQVAQSAGVAKALPFYYFTDKRGLYIAATQRQVDLEMAQWHARVEHERARARIRALLHRHFSYLEHHRLPYLSMMRRRTGIPDVEEIFERARLESITVTLGHLDLELDLDARGRAALRGWVAFNDEITVQWFEHGGLSVEEVTDLSLAMFIAALETLADRYPEVGPAAEELRKPR